MKLAEFLAAHNIDRNPFAEEDAQTDAVFRQGCLWKIHHPAWDKFYGSPETPSTAVVFGEKGSGKTALRLQVTSELEKHNASHPESRVFVVEYDDFNPFLDHFRAAVRAKDGTEALKKWQLRDHMDAILALAVTQLVDTLSHEQADLSRLSPDQRRDLLLLASIYDQSTGEPIARRWNRLRRRSGFRPLWTRRDLQIGVGVTLLVLLAIFLFPPLRSLSILPWLILPFLLGWGYWGWRLAQAERFARDIRHAVRVLVRDPAALRWELLWFRPTELAGQPLPNPRGTGEERYELLRKFQAVLKALAFSGIIVLIDRVDEPQMIEGDPRKMRAFIWPLLDHKFMRHPGVGFKILLPIELAYYLEKEDREFYDRSRPDKLNLIKPLRWSGPSLYDLASDRIRVCSTETPKPGEESPRLRQLLDPAITDDYLRDALGSLRTPRQLFKFLHRLLEEHCQRHTSDQPRNTIDPDTFRTVFSNHLRELEAFDRGYGHG
jgi:hypothetical protein